MTILDHLGKPMTFDKKVMKDRIARPSRKGVRAVKTKSTATGLNPVKCAKLIKAANEGDIFDYLTVAEEIEELRGHYYSVLQTRKLALRGVEPVVKAASDDKKDLEIAEEIKAIVDAPEFTDLVFGLADAISKGFSVCEIMYDFSANVWRPNSYIWQDPRNFTFDVETRTRPLLRQDEGDAAALDYGKFVYHTPKLKSGITIRGGLARVAIWPIMFASFSERDWMAFTEVFGMPVRIGKYQHGASDEDIDMLWRAVSGIASDSAAVIPESMTIDFIAASNSAKGDAIFAKAAEHFDASVSKIVLGQTMTTEDGSSNSQAQVHNDVRMDILEADAKALAATIQRDLINTYVAFNYGAAVKPPTFSLPVPKPEDVAVFVKGVVDLVPMGLRVATADLYEKLGISEPAKDAEILAIGDVQNAPGRNDKKSNKNKRISLNKTQEDDAGDLLDDADDLLDDYEAEYFGDFVDAGADMADQILKKLDEAGSFEEFQQMLDEFDTSDVDPKLFVNALAKSGFVARSSGEDRD